LSNAAKMLETNPVWLVMATCAITENIQAQLAEHCPEEAALEILRIVEEAVLGWEKTGHMEAQEDIAVSNNITLKTRRLAICIAQVPLNKAAGSARNIEYSLKVMKGDRIYYLDTDLLEETALMGCVKDRGDLKEFTAKIPEF
jgi:hypothetical protein